MPSFTVSCPHCQEAVTLQPASLSNTVSCPHCSKAVLDGRPVEGDSYNFAALIQSPKPVVAIFWGNNCAPCQAFKPVVDQVAQQKKQYRFVRVNVNQHPALAKRYQVRGVPTVLIFRKGRQQAVLNTALRKPAFLKWLAEVLG
ncbi:thioredoxin domain-containing protein [Photobacterium sp. 1_MG-2023]|uniref:thioredoxin domain-containing protein n=1 Tax=Photobacterium sp. 1_MG-2023 TaxID=3062646 RepID=UPI0026E3B773|nr:thioredoxin domain-containing protein [Photobacterium sp. 1_MG-2023]MDO6707047.1 thioredoxin domain-containing protein [Photobacterium sp. 1_MG-2023]